MREHSEMNLSLPHFQVWDKGVKYVLLQFEASKTAPGIVLSLQAVSNRSSIDSIFLKKQV